MPYRLKLLFADGSFIVSPFIAPNNPNHTFDELSIVKEIHKTGTSLV